MSDHATGEHDQGSVVGGRPQARPPWWRVSFALILAVLAFGALLVYTAVDTDTDEWCKWREVSLDGGPAERDWVWRENRIRRLLEISITSPLFIAGCKSNQGVFYDHFDHVVLRFDPVVLLSAPTDVMLECVAARTTNPFGKRAEDRAKIVRDTREVVPLLRAGADIEIDTAATPLDTVVAALVDLAAGG